MGDLEGLPSVRKRLWLSNDEGSVTKGSRDPTKR